MYFLGDLGGCTVKIGITDDLVKRRRQIEQSQTTPTELRLLAAIGASRTHESKLLKHFAPLRVADVQREDIFRPEPELTEYINWLRHQWFTTLDEKEPQDIEVDPDRWWPTDDRRIPAEAPDPERLIQVTNAFTGELAGTAWAWMASPELVHQDYYTDPALIAAARDAMGDIDLDAASHWLANREFKIPDYFHLNRSAFEHPWHGRVWLNPPYGDNPRWIDRILNQRSAFDQLCMLSPAWAFTTKAARPLMAIVSAGLLLSPTPKFWGNPNGDGSNHPHMVVYIGDRPERFVAAFADFGIPMALDMRWARAA